jgi:hypothetical protein
MPLGKTVAHFTFQTKGETKQTNATRRHPHQNLAEHRGEHDLDEDAARLANILDVKLPLVNFSFSLRPVEFMKGITLASNPCTLLVKFFLHCYNRYQGNDIRV